MNAGPRTETKGSRVFSDLELMPGDIGLSTDKSWLAAAIKFVQNLWTGSARWTHAFACVCRGGKYIVEAVAKISINPISKYEGKSIALYRLPISDPEREAFSIGMIRRVNGAYGWLKYPLFILDAGVTSIKRFFGMKQPCFFFTRHFGISNIPVCSQLVVWGIHTFTSYRFRDELGREVNWRIVTPDYLEDLLLLPHNEAILIYEFQNP